MPDCATCQLFHLEAEGDTCFHVNRPGGLKLTEQALELSQLPVGAHILDVASGTSTTLNFLADQKQFNAIGLDLSIRMLQSGRSRYANLKLLQADCKSIPLADASQQAVLMECALSLTGSAEATLREFMRVLVPGGKLIFTDIYVSEISDLGGMDCLSLTHCLAGAATEESIQRKIAAGGFTLKIWQDHTLVFKQWLAQMVFKLGSLEAFYRQLVSCEGDTASLTADLGKKIKLGYYLLIAEKGNT
ncbi:MAG: methyltransferase domain-containing protein [Anaerolineaceae bacterium]|nr:methyltransferase domain-containing protein [Anaerolineaceae bacterium]